MLGAETNVNGMGIETIQPLDGPSIYREWLDSHGERFHHIAVMKHMAEESEMFKKEMAARGAAILMGGRIGETIEYYYLDTVPALKIIVESGSGRAIDLTPSRVFKGVSREETSRMGYRRMKKRNPGGDLPAIAGRAVALTHRHQRAARSQDRTVLPRRVWKPWPGVLRDFHGRSTIL